MTVTHTCRAGVCIRQPEKTRTSWSGVSLLRSLCFSTWYLGKAQQRNNLKNSKNMVLVNKFDNKQVWAVFAHLDQPIILIHTKIVEINTAFVLPFYFTKTASMQLQRTNLSQEGSQVDEAVVMSRVQLHKCLQCSSTVNALLQGTISTTSSSKITSRENCPLLRPGQLLHNL